MDSQTLASTVYSTTEVMGIQWVEQGELVPLANRMKSRALLPASKKIWKFVFCFHCGLSAFPEVPTSWYWIFKGDYGALASGDPRDFASSLGCSQPKLMSKLKWTKRWSVLYINAYTDSCLPLRLQSGSHRVHCTAFICRHDIPITKPQHCVTTAMQMMLFVSINII